MPSPIVLRPRRPVGVVQSKISAKPKPGRKITLKKKARVVLGKRGGDGP